jgi:hypothetical protein
MFIYAEVGSSKFVEMIDAQMQHFLTEDVKGDSVVYPE